MKPVVSPPFARCSPRSSAFSGTRTAILVYGQLWIAIPLRSEDAVTILSVRASSSALAYCFAVCASPLHVFVSTRGSLETLDALRDEGALPILYRSVDLREGGLVGHYFFYGGRSGGEVSFYDGLPGEDWSRSPEESFLSLWTERGERWFMTVFRPGETRSVVFPPGRFLPAFRSS